MGFEHCLRNRSNGTCDKGWQGGKARNIEVMNRKKMEQEEREMDK